MAIALGTADRAPHAGAGSPRRQRSRLRPGRVLAWAYLAAVLFITIFPFYWVLRTALSNNYKLDTDPSSLLPTGFTFGAFERVLGLATPAQAIAQGGSGASLDLLLYLRNSVIYASLLTACVVFFSALAAYAFARLHWRGRNAVFSVFLCALMIPGVLTLLPNFVLIKDLGLVNSFLGLILPGALFSAFDIFFLRQFMLGLSTEIEEAAVIDGAGKLTVLFRIILPMSAVPLTTLVLLTFINTWNDYFWPLLVANNQSVQPLTLGLALFKQASPETAPDWAGLMAATVVAALPMLLLFMLFGRRIVNAIGFSGLK
jgi:ABC-type glycerol-3-phosphate transport system permease component